MLPLFNNGEVVGCRWLLEEDVGLRPNSTIFAISTFDKTVQIWDASKPKKHFSKLSGHSEHVLSLDFHPRKSNMFCSYDSNNEMRMWNVSKQTCTHNSQGHVKEVRSFCSDTSGQYIASVSEDSARIWTINSDGRCIHEFSNGNKFESCTFHPGYSQLTVIGTHQTLELWNPTDSNRTRSYPAHSGIIAALADSPHTETIASAGHDQWLKLWRCGSLSLLLYAHGWIEVDEV